MKKEKCINLLKNYFNKLEYYHPFFIFYSQDFDKRDIISDMRILYEADKISKIFQINIFNISIVKNLNEINDELVKKYNYYNFISHNNVKYVYPINIGLYGKTKSGKSTLINKILGEKQSFNHPTEPTPKSLHFEHKNIPIVFYDTEGFDSEKSVEVANEQLTESFESIKEEIHIIYYVMNFDNRLEEKERKFLEKQKNNLNRIIFIGTHQEGVHEQYKKKLIEDFKKNKIYNDNECKKIKNNIFCLDLINDNEESNINEIKDILKRTFEIGYNFYKSIKNNAEKNIKKTLKEGEDDAFETVKKNRIKQGKDIISSRSWKVFGCGFIPLPLLDKQKMESQIKEMIKELVYLYKDIEKAIYEDNQVGPIIAKSLGLFSSFIGGIAGSTSGESKIYGAFSGAATAGEVGAGTTTVGEVGAGTITVGAIGAGTTTVGVIGAGTTTVGTVGTGTTAAGTVGTATTGITSKIVSGVGIGIVLYVITGIISGSLGKKNCIELGEKLLYKFSEIFEKHFEKEKYIKTCYEQFVSGIEKSRKIIEYFKVGQTYDSSLNK